MARGFRVRKATLRDLDLLVRHRRAMWMELGRFSRPALEASDSVYRRWLRQKMVKKRIVAFVAVDAGQVPVGSLTIWLHDIEPGPDQPRGVNPLLSTLYVERGSRRKGIGSALVRTATKWCRDSGYPYVTGIAAHTSRRILRRLGYLRLWEMGQYFGNEPA
jgi:GNAT superfamily N-acetyltransferase